MAQQPSFEEFKTALDEYAAAEYLNSTVGTLRVWRSTGRGPAFVKVANKVRYLQSDLAAYVYAHRVTRETA
ncbi:helix-turn-helix domain-containing protein [Dietzia cinnamea]|uniref:helix-turn-helix domain-containing protein n=1 Tax=Dietzia cinnamea TaxID=321318 RepID=UPI0021A73682|nr:helix-turn-helix domain-containing protein [Dietzia cinnamea]MCT1884976.1 helix-turn-helix domain-containing protein [Dietzia cinnamea]